ncbi:hypothetical protein N657DRAFT_713678 [Parathielavia appendiculata]|uniref:Uncharacterized protein n=1 Tax=Parathielavia appendiculata TaxID=2587402 RepID=A0AAN6TQ02_9PEZI|nr:hypothetical protein N657DRAFT_713678 [Parathielavia appendiculata]
MENPGDLTVIAISTHEDAPLSAHDDLIAKVNKERGLGDHTKALVLYREAEDNYADLYISMWVAGLIALQGHVPLAIRELDRSLVKYALVEDHRELVAAARMLLAFWWAKMDLDYFPALKIGLKYFGEYVKPYPPSEWKDYKVGDSFLSGLTGLADGSLAEIAALLIPSHSRLSRVSGVNLIPFHMMQTRSKRSMIQTRVFLSTIPAKILPIINPTSSKL